MVRIVARICAGFPLAALLLFPTDWIAWRIRDAAGRGMDRVMVTQVTVTSLKGNKEEYFVDGATEVECSRSLFPQAGAGACWWLRRHSQIVTRE